MKKFLRSGSRATVDLTGASVAVTGGASGIGRAIAERFVRAGARVTIGDIDLRAAEAAAAQLSHGALAVAFDVTDEQSYSTFLDSAEAAHGPLAVLVNNAGVDWMGPFDQSIHEVSLREVSVNLVGPIIGSRLALQRMLPRDRGHIVNVASGAGRLPQPGSAVYTATKYGVVGFTECLDMEYRKTGIRFSLMHPGYIRTAMTEGTTRPSRLIPTATPDDCAVAVVDAVRHNRFDVWAPAGQKFAVRAGNILGRSVRDRMLFAVGIGRIASDSDSSARSRYYAQAFPQFSGDDAPK